MNVPFSWSPDGAHITASNATNNKGFVFIAAVITRNTWTSDISLVGHENTIEVAVSSSIILVNYFPDFCGRRTILIFSYGTLRPRLQHQTYVL